MRILLIGEYSNLHWALAEGLRTLGHEVCVVSGGDFWKQYPSDISIIRHRFDKLSGLTYLIKILSHLPKFRGYDVVQIINPCFFDIKAERNLTLFEYLRKHNRKIFLGAFGNDYYWVKTCTQTNTFRYSDFFVNNQPRITSYTQSVIHEWIDSPKEQVNRYMAEKCDGIIACLYEYWASYQSYFPDKTVFIPLPVSRNLIRERKVYLVPDKVHLFLGIQRTRSDVKGTDIMERVVDNLAIDYADKCIIQKAVSVPFNQYQQMIESSDALLDQIYSYTPAMNALTAMAKGIIAVSGGEPENYQIIQENGLRPIINVLPDEDDIYKKLEELILNKEQIPELQRQSIEYIRRHHDHVKVAAQYLKFWESR